MSQDQGIKKGIFILVMLFCVSISQCEGESIPVNITVMNDLTKEKVSYSTSVKKHEPMFGALNNLQDTNKTFSFTYSIDKHFGIFLESVNGVARSKENQTYWWLLSEIDGVTTPLNVGIGCYQPHKDENLILKFITWYNLK